MTIDKGKQAVLTSAAALSAFQASVVSLVGKNWTLSNEALNISIPAQLPSQAHLDLRAANVIDDPLFDLNEFDLRWVARANWTYTSDPIQDLDRDATSTWLRFDGLDTFSSIYFCGELVATTDNQFRQYIYDITEVLTSCPLGDERLSIEFGPAPLIADSIAATPGQQTWPEGIQSANEFGNVFYIRKEQNDFGWDWGPSLSPAGPWQPAYVVQLASDAVHVSNVDIDIYREEQLPLLPPDQTKDWVLNVSMDYIGHLADDAVMRYVLQDCSNVTVLTGALNRIRGSETTVTGLTTISKDRIELWWPRGLGEQVLYYLTISLIDKHDNTLASITKRTGFRTIVLNMEPVTEIQLRQGVAPGSNWKFEINGHEFYALGSNFIPPDPFWPNVTDERLTRLLDDVIEGNQNMLRLWSSGAYGSDLLYDLADERGILLWSEFEFSDHLYPSDQPFLDNVFAEAEYHVRRVNHHPSLALWAGGNELESLMLQNIARKIAPDRYDQYVGEYEKLFIDTLTPAVFRNTRSISYTPSSTSNGWLTLNYTADRLRPFTERYLNKTVGHIYGDTDFYNYDPGILGNISAYPIGRFSNEFGFLSLPSVQSWRQQVSENQLYLGSRVTTLRCHHNVPGINESNYDAANVGIDQMKAAIERWYPIPNKSDPLSNFTAWIYATQVFQADLYRSEIEFYRRGSSMPERQLGSLYWQLEDQWVAPTWAGIEYDGRWKMLHYAAKDIYEPVIVAAYPDSTTGKVAVYVTSALWEQVSGSATFSWYNWAGRRLNVDHTTSTTFTVGAINSTKVLDFSLSEALHEHDIADAVLHIQITVRGRLPNTNEVRTFRHENWFHPEPLKTSRLVDPSLTLHYNTTSSNFTITAQEGIAAWVWLDYPAGAVLSFSSNGFWLAPNETRHISYKVKSDTTNGDWVHKVTAISMWDLTTST